MPNNQIQRHYKCSEKIRHNYCGSTEILYFSKLLTPDSDVEFQYQLQSIQMDDSAQCNDS